MTHALRAPGLIVLFVALHACLTVFLANALSIWIDEAYTLKSTGSGIGHAVQQAIRFELQPPAFYMLLSVWRKLDPGLFFARLFSVLCAAAAIPVMAMAWIRYEPRVHPGWIAAALAFNPAVVWAAVEARPYALSLLLATALLWLFEMGFLSDAPRFSSRMAYAAVGILALYTQYYLGFLLLGGGVALAVLGRWSALRDYLGWMLWLLAAFIPLALAVPGQVSLHTAHIPPSSLAESINHALGRPADLLLSTGSLGGGRAVRWLFRITLAAVILVGCTDVLTSRPRFKPQVVALAVILLTIVCSLLGVELLFGQMITLKRHMLFVLPAGMLLLYGVASARGSRPAVAAVTALLLSSAGWALYVQYKPLAKLGDHARVAAYLGLAEAEGEPIFVFPGEWALPLSHHYRGRNELVALPVPASLTRYDLSVFVWRDRDHVVQKFHRVGASDTCWLITYPKLEQFFGLPLRSELLEAVVKSDFEILERRQFDAGPFVRKLRRRADSNRATAVP